MLNWKEDKTSKALLAGFSEFKKKHIPADLTDSYLESLYGLAIDNILKNGETDILDVQRFAGKKLKKFYLTMVKYKDFLEMEEVFDAYILLIRRGVELPKNLERDILEISKLEFEYLGKCTFREFYQEVEKEVDSRLQIRHFKDFKQKVRNGDFQ